MNGLMALTYSPSPSGMWTMTAFPHVVSPFQEDKHAGGASDEGEYVVLISVVGLVYVLLLVCAFPAVMYFAWREVATTMLESSFSSMGWWGFLFEDYRPMMMLWALVMVGKDIALNMVVVTLPGFGTFQLMIMGTISLIYAYWVMRLEPFEDVSNSYLEVWNSVAVAAMCIFAAGMGFQSEPEVGDIGDFLEGGTEDPIYFQRTVLFVILQALVMTGPVLIVGYQLLMSTERTQRLVPRCLHPISREAREGWNLRFFTDAQIEEGCFRDVLEGLDARDFCAFRRLMRYTVSGMGIVDRQDSWRSRLHALHASSSSNLASFPSSRSLNSTDSQASAASERFQAPAAVDGSSRPGGVAATNTLSTAASGAPASKSDETSSTCSV